MRRKVLVTTAALATLTLAACHRPADRVDYMNNRPNTSYAPRNNYRNNYRDNYGDNYRNNYRNNYRSNYGDNYGDNYSNNNGNNYRNNNERDDYSRDRGTRDANLENRSTMDPHYDYVNQLGFTNITNTAGDSYHHRYRLNARNAADNDVFHGWRHTWVEPNDYMDKDIDVYRYTGDYNGKNRTIHILSHRGTPIGGYHFGEGETAEHARMIDRDGYFSRVADDFRDTWDDLFDIRR